MSFTGVGEARRRVIRAPSNPLDKSTVISIYPKEINEVKHTIQPGRFHISPGTYEKPSLLVVGPSSWWREIDEEQPLLELTHSSIQVADSIIIDYCNGLLGYNGRTCMPGLFYIPGALTIEEIRKSYQHTVDEARDSQKAWYTSLIRLADGLWARSNGNPLAISEDMRIAARESGQPNKDWMKDFQASEMSRCKACGTLRNPNYPICPTCKAIDNPARAKELGIVFAQ